MAALLRQEGVLNAHGAHIIVVVDVELPGKGPALLALGGGLDVLVGSKVVHHQGDAALVEHLVKARRLKFVDGHRGGDVVAQHQVQLGLDQLSGPNAFQSRVTGQDLLCHCHSHADTLLIFKRLRFFGSAGTAAGKTKRPSSPVKETKA